MIKIKYVGLKTDGERAFAELTGIAVWFQGDVKEVSEAHAAAMLKHPDVFAAADAKASLSEAKVKAPEATKTTDPLAGLDDAAVRAYAKEQGVKIKGIALFKGANLRAKVSASLRA